MAQWLGILIRRERLRQNLSQEGLCKGVCAVSYLSKIEQGKVEAGGDILDCLLRRLGLRYETDPAFLQEARERVDRLYAGLSRGREDQPPLRADADALHAQRDRYLASPFLLDASLLLAIYRGEPCPDLSDFVPFMASRQYTLYLLVRTIAGDPESGRLLSLRPSGYAACCLGQIAYAQGRYFEAIDLLQQGFRLASEEGSPDLMCRAKLFLGNCYSDCGQKELMLSCYEQARRLAESLDSRSLLPVIEYNIGSTLLSWNLVEEGYRRLKDLDSTGALYRHKLALALEKLGRREEALEEIVRGRSEEGADEPAVAQMLDAAEYRLRHPDALDDPEYARILEEAFRVIRRDCSQGYVRFHAPYLLELYEHQRRYKDAYRLLLEFSPFLPQNAR